MSQQAVERPRRSVVVAPGEGQPFWSVQDLMNLKIHAADTGGQFSLYEMTCLPGGGPPPHAHAREDEMFFVLDGTFTFVYEDTTFTGGPGTAVYMPRDTIHTFTNKTDRPAKALVWAGSDNFEQFMNAFGVPLGGSPTPPPPDAALFSRLRTACKTFQLRMLPEHKPTRTVSAPPNAAGPLTVLGAGVVLPLVGKTTNGRLCVAELTVPPRVGPPAHRHAREDEVFYVIDGTFEVTIDGCAHPLPTGATAYVPRGSFHRFENVGHTSGRIFSLHTPGGFEHFFTECGALSVRGIELDREGMASFLAKHGMDVPA